jgi:hypothetical protein
MPHLLPRARLQSVVPKERILLAFPPREGGMLRLSIAFSATLTGMGPVRMGAQGRYSGVNTDPGFALSVI